MKKKHSFSEIDPGVQPTRSRPESGSCALTLPYCHRGWHSLRR